MKKVIIASPCYNCELQVVRVAKATDLFLKTFSSAEFWIEKVIFMDNRSQDLTIDSLEKVLKTLNHPTRFQIVQNDKNYGLGGSHKAIFSYALQNEVDFVAIIHGDNQADINDLARLLTISQQEKFATVLGSRFSKAKRSTHYSKVREIGNRALNLIYSLVLQTKIEDLGSGLNLINVSSLKDNLFMSFDDNFTFNMDLLIYLISQKKNTLFSPISWKSEDEVSNVRALEVGLRALIKIISWNLWRQKMWNEPSQFQTYRFRTIYDG